MISSNNYKKMSHPKHKEIFYNGNYKDQRLIKLLKVILGLATLHTVANFSVKVAIDGELKGMPFQEGHIV